MEPTASQPNPPTTLWSRWHGTPLYLRILVGLVLGVIAGLLLGKNAEYLAIPSKLILRLLGALAPALILVAVVHALLTVELQGRLAGRLAFLLLLNTTVAICIGLFVANVVRPGQHEHLPPKPAKSWTDAAKTPTDASIAKFLKDNNVPLPPEKPAFADQFLENVPQSLLGPLGDNGKVIGVIFIAVAFGIALRSYRTQELRTVEDWVELGFNLLVTILHWVIELVPLGVFGIIAKIVGTQGFGPFKDLLWFVAAVLLALFLQGVYYLTRIRMGSWVRPGYLLKNTRDALIMAFSTDSSTATMPLTYACLRNKVGLRERSASLGSLVGSNFNNDGTALYEAMSALFIGQMIGKDLSLGQQLMVVITSIVASVGAAGIPEAGLVTMTLVFTAVKLPVDYIGLLLAVDWFLDRSRTVINVMGDINTSCLLDGQEREVPSEMETASA